MVAALVALWSVPGWSVWVTVFFAAFAVAAAVLGLALMAAAELFYRRVGNYDERTMVYEFPFLVRERTINKFIERLEAAGLSGVRFQWNWQTMSLQCGLPDSYRHISEWVVIEGVEATIKNCRPLAARPMRRREPAR